MASILKVDTIQDQSGNNIINESADTITIGASGDTITIPATNLAGAGAFVQIYANNNDIRQLMTINYLDSPSTTSSTTYTLYFLAGAGTAYINQEGSKQGQIILTEIGG
jgi:hypothetical protein